MNKKMATLGDAILAMECNDVVSFKNFISDHETGTFVDADIAKCLLMHIEDDTDPAIVLRALRSFANNMDFYTFAEAFFVVTAENDSAELEDFGKDIAKDLKEGYFGKRSLRQIRKMDGDYINAFMSYVLRETDSVNRNLNYAVLTAIFNAKILPQRELALMVATCVEDVRPVGIMVPLDDVFEMFDEFAGMHKED